MLGGELQLEMPTEGHRGRGEGEVEGEGEGEGMRGENYRFWSFQPIFCNL
jgi:hypothetical protein